MYYALLNGEKIPTERLHWVRLQSNGVYINCKENEGHGIILGGEIYHVDGRGGIDKPTVDLIWQDDVTALAAANKMLSAQVAALSDENSFQEELIVELANHIYA